MDQVQKSSRWNLQMPVFSGWTRVSGKTSSMFLAGLGLMVVSSLTFTLWNWIREAWKATTSSFVTSMELNSRDDTYTWFMEWMHAQPWAKNFRRVSVSTTWVEHDEGESKAVVLYTPDVGNYVIRYKGHKVWLQRSRDESNSADQLAHFGGVFERVKLTAWGSSRIILQDLINEAMELYMHKEEGKTIIYTAVHGNWQRFGPPRPVRPLFSVVLDSGVSERLVADAKDFLNSASWYSDRGIPYRRGYLLYGPPGTGKTSFVTALAGHLGMSICVVNLNNPEISDEHLVFLLNKTPGKKCLILIEDVDAAPAAQNRSGSSSHETHHRSNVSLSGLLNAMDGVASQEGRLLFMTTNHIERLDPALSRPGRIDVRVELGYAKKDQLERLFLNFYPEQKKLAVSFAESIPESVQLTTALVQSHFMNFKNDAQAAVSNAALLKESRSYE